MRRLGAGMIIAAMLVGGFSLWTLIPLGWIWVGSQISTSQQPQLGVYVLVLAGIAISVFAVARGLGALNRRLAELHGISEGPRIPLPWMRSMRDEQRSLRTTTLDAVLIGSALLAMLAAGIWFFFFAGSPLPGQ